MRLLLYFFSFALLGQLIGCSSPQTQEQAIVENVHDDGTSIPASVIKFTKILDKKSVDYEIATYQATADILSSGKSALQAADSPRALKILTVGTRLFPWRSDIGQYRELALRKYIDSTNLMIKDSSNSCSSIEERVQYLDNAAPDSKLQIVGYKNRCPQIENTTSIQAPHEESLLNFFKDPSPVASSFEKRDDIDLADKLDSIIKRNSPFPVEDLLLLGFKNFFYKFKDYVVIYNDFTISSDTVSDSNYEVTARYRPQYFPPVKLSFFKKVLATALYGRDWDKPQPIPENWIIHESQEMALARAEYCNYLEKVLTTPGNSREETFRVDQVASTDRANLVVCLSSNSVLSFRTTIPLREKYTNFINFNPISNPEGRIFALDYRLRPAQVIVLVTSKYTDRTEHEYYRGWLPSESERKMRWTSKAGVKGLVQISYQVDFYNTYLMNKSVLTGKSESYASWWKSFEPDGYKYDISEDEEDSLWTSAKYGKDDDLYPYRWIYELPQDL